jgi:hypothetical protein
VGYFCVGFIEGSTLVDIIFPEGSTHVVHSAVLLDSKI